MQYEDFTPGRQFRGDSLVLTKAEIRAFATSWDPQPFHTDPEIAAAGEWGGLIASGWHTACIAMRCFCESVLCKAHFSVSPGVDHLRWLQPVRPGDRLSLLSTVLEQRHSASRPATGILRWRWQLENQHGETVLTAESATLIHLVPPMPSEAETGG